MKVTVIGGGNIGTLMAAEMAKRGFEVTMCTSKPEVWNNDIDVMDETQNILFSAKLYSITSDIKLAIEEASVIWITFPAQLFEKIANDLLPYIKPGQLIGIVPGSGGVEFAFKKILDKGAILFGLQRVHSIARIEKYGKSVHMLGRKPRLELGSIPANKASDISNIVEKMFEIPCKVLPNYISVTLTPSNPILHTARLYTMFKDYRDGVVYPRNFLFYEEWDDESSDKLICCDAELQKLCQIVPCDLSNVESLPVYYESYSVSAMTNKISHIKAFKGLTSPMVKVSNGWIPDFNSRYFTTDFPYGLKIIKDLAEIYNVDIPNINEVWEWYEKFDPIHAKSAICINNYSEKEINEIYL